MTEREEALELAREAGVMCHPQESRGTVMKLSELEKLKAEVKRLKRIVRQWQKLHDYENMAKRYGEMASIVNIGRRPKLPEYL